MKVMIHGDIKSLYLLNLLWPIPDLHGPYVLKKLVKITGRTLVIIGAGPLLNAVCKTVPAYPIEVRSFSHGILPAYLFAVLDPFPHSPVIFTGSTVVEIITTLEVYYTRLHPYTWIGCPGIFIRLYRPDLPPDNRFYARTFAGVALGTAAV